MVGNFYINKLLERTVFLACPDSGGWMHKGRLRISQMHSEKAVKFGTSFGGDEALFKCITIANKCICIKCRIEGWEDMVGDVVSVNSPIGVLKNGNKPILGFRIPIGHRI